MRRAPIVLAATVAGMASVLAFKPHEPSFSTASAGVVATTMPPTGSGSAPTGSGSGSGGESGTGSSSGSGASGQAGTKVVTGDSIATQYGNAQVRVTITGGKITNVEALQLQAGDPHSMQISSAAEPLLRASALAKQSAAIDAVSGATFTSASYEASLQSALDKAGYTAPDGSVGSATVPSGESEHGGPGGFR